VEETDVIEKIIAAGVIPALLSFLHPDRCGDLEIQLEVLGSLINLTGSSHTGMIVEEGGVPVFIRLLGSSSEDIQEQAVWCLGNIAAHSVELRDTLLKDGAM
ncbi:unnamed protein product, partial [Discosporangium mesarthrocarpum]